MQHRHREKGLSAIRIYKPHTQPFCANFHHHTNSTPILTFIARLLLRDVTVSPSKNKLNKERKKRNVAGRGTDWLWHAAQTPRLVSELLSVSRRRCSQGPSCQNNLTALEWLKSQRRNPQFVTAVQKQHHTESWYFHMRLSSVMQSLLW